MSINLSQKQANSVLRFMIFYAQRNRVNEFRKIVSNLIALSRCEEQHEEYMTAKLMNELGVDLTLDPIAERVDKSGPSDEKWIKEKFQQRAREDNGE